MPLGRPSAIRYPSSLSVALLRRVPSAVWGLVALGVGMVAGTLLPETLAPIGAGVKAAFRFLANAAPYIIFFTLAPSIGDMLRTGSAAKFAAAVLFAFFLATVLAGAWAIAVLVPLFGIGVGATELSFLEVVGQVGGETAHLALTSPPFIAIWYSALVAVGLHLASGPRATRWFARPTADVLRLVGVDGVELVGRALRAVFPAVLFSIGVFIPTGIAQAIVVGSGAIENTGALGAFGGSSPVRWYFLAVGILVLLLGTYLAAAVVLVCRLAKFPLRRFFTEYFLYVFPFAWATSSSAATIPINLERAHRGLRVRKEVRDFIIPLGATVNLDGTMIGAYVLTVVAGILVGYPPSLLDLLILVVPLAIITHGVPGIPGGVATIAPPVIATFLALPADVAPSFIAIWFGFSIGLSDQFRTGVNSVNNGVISLLFEHWYPRFSKGAPAPEGSPSEPAASGERPPAEPPA